MKEENEAQRLSLHSKLHDLRGGCWGRSDRLLEKYFRPRCLANLLDTGSDLSNQLHQLFVVSQRGRIARRGTAQLREMDPLL